MPSKEELTSQVRKLGEEVAALKAQRSIGRYTLEDWVKFRTSKGMPVDKNAVRIMLEDAAFLGFENRIVWDLREAIRCTQDEIGVLEIAIRDLQERIHNKELSRDACQVHQLELEKLLALLGDGPLAELTDEEREATYGKFGEKPPAKQAS